MARKPAGGTWLARKEFCYESGNEFDAHQSSRSSRLLDQRD
jgi:hypothetical protein